jgi:hypothetical protein
MIKVFCNNCKNKTNHEVLKEELVNYPLNDDGEFFNYKYQIIRCNGCETISFRVEEESNTNYDPEYDQYYITENIYPKRTDKLVSMKSFYEAPSKVRNIYKEVIATYYDNNFILCAAGVRAIMDGICSDKKILNGMVEREIRGTKKTKKSNALEGKIQGLLDAGFISKQNVKSLHELRFFGNEAIHDLSLPSQTELEAAISVIENIIENIYEIEEKTNVIKGKRIKRAIIKGKS